MSQQCQGKNDTQVEKVATIFSSRIEDRAMRSQLVMRFEKCEHQTREEILPGMREDAGTQTAPKEREQTEERAEDCKQDHVACALVSVRCTEENRGARHPHCHRAPRPRGELAMKVSAKHHFLRQSGDDA